MNNLSEQNKVLLDRVLTEVQYMDRTFFNSLSEHEAKLVLNILQEYSEEGDSNLHKTLWEIDYTEKPVSIEKFITDKNYLGIVGKELYPIWQDELSIVCKEGSKIVEWLFTGAIGGGKTTCANFAQAYKSYRLMCLRDPAAYYDLMGEGVSTISIAFFNITIPLAKKVTFGKYQAMLKSSPWFKERIQLNINNNVVGLTDQVKIILGSGITHAIGSDTVGGCFTGDTKVSLLNGTECEISKLPSEFWVYACDENGNIIPAKGNSPRITKIVTQILQITLDNDEKIKCTPDHRFMLRDGSYKEAQLLTEGDSLMPLYRKLSDKETDGLKEYEMVKSNYDESWSFTHRLSDKLVYKEKKHTVRHHKDFNKYNNDPDNIQWMTWIDHRKLHNDNIRLLWDNPDFAKKVKEVASKNLTKRNIINWEDPIYRQKMSKTLNGVARMYWLSICDDEDKLKEFKNKMSESSKRSWNLNYKKRKSIAVKNLVDYNTSELKKDQTTEFNKNRWSSDIDYRNKMKDVSVINGKQAGLIRLKNIYNTLKEKQLEFTEDNFNNNRPKWHPRYNVIFNFYDNINDFIAYCENYNHKVRLIEIINCEPIEVWDITVDMYHNFCLSAGVVVHNSMDEMDFSKSVDGKQVQEAYDALHDRVTSRYMKFIHKEPPGLMTLISSTTQDSNSFMNKRLKRAEQYPEITHISNFAQWETKPIPVELNTGSFKVFIGDNLTLPIIIEQGHEDEYDESLIIEVPNAYRHRFDDDLEHSIINLAGKRIGAKQNLFLKRVDKLKECLNGRTIFHPFKSESIFVSIDRPDSIQSHFDKEKFVRFYYENDNKYAPLINPNKERFIHVDLAKNGDFAGMSCVHCSGFITKDIRVDNETVKRYKEPLFYQDWSIQMMYVKGSEIDFEKINDFIYFLASIGTKIGGISFDSYQSVGNQQSFKKSKICDEKRIITLSVDTSPEPYKFFRKLIIENRISMYNHAILINEITKLVRDPDTLKVDHDGNLSTKDVSDSLVGAIEHCGRYFETADMGQVRIPLVTVSDYAINKDGIKGTNKDSNKHYPKV